MKYAIVESGGKQFKAVEGGTLEVDRLPSEPGTPVTLDRVLLLVDEGGVTVGVPHIADTVVWTEVLEHFKGDKVTIFNYSPKKRIRVKTGHRQNYTRLKVHQIGGQEFIIKPPEKMAKRVEKAEAETAVEVREPVKKAVAEKLSTKPRKSQTSKSSRISETPEKPEKKPVRSGTKKPAAVKKPATKK